MPSSRTNTTIRLTDERRAKLVQIALFQGMSKASLLEQWCNDRIDAVVLPRARAPRKPVVAPAGKVRTSAVKDNRRKVTATSKRV